MKKEHDLLDTTPAPSKTFPKQKDSVKNNLEKKAKASVKKGTNKPAAKKVAKKAPAAKKSSPALVKPVVPSENGAKPEKPKRTKAPIVPGTNVKPTLSHKQVQTLRLLSVVGTANIKALIGIVYEKASGEVTPTEINTFRKTTLSPLVDKELVHFDDTDKKNILYRVNPKKLSKSTELDTLLKVLPTDPEKAVTVGVLGGQVWGGKQPKDPNKRDIWINVRFGRAAGAILKKLVAAGAVGIAQPNSRKPKGYYRNAPKA